MFESFRSRTANHFAVLVFLSVASCSAVADPATVKNLLANPSFEVGVDGWTFEDRWTVKGSRAITEDAAFHGKRSMKLTMPPGGASGVRRVGVHTDWISLDSGQTAALSVYARALSGAPEVTLSFRYSRAGKTFTLGKKWTRCVLTDKLKLRNPYEVAKIQLTAPGSVLIDAAQLEIGEPTEFQPQPQAELGLVSDCLPSLIHPGEKTVVGFDVYRPSTEESPASDLTVTWEYGDHETPVIRRQEYAVEVAPGRHHSRRIPWTAPEETGLCHWRAILRDGERKLAERKYAMGVVPPQPGYEPGPHSIFGFCITFSDIRFSVESARRMGIPRFRLIGNVSPFFPRGDEKPWPEEPIINFLHENGFPLSVNIGRHGNSKKLIRKFRQNWFRERLKENLEELARRYRGKIQAYEIWNEPSAHLDADDYVEFHTFAHAALKHGDPDALIGAPSVMGKEPKWLRQTLAAGLGDVLDVVTIHGHMRQPPERGVPQYIGRVMGPHQSILKKHGVDHLPIWDTESGYLADDAGVPKTAPRWYYKSERVQARYSVRQYLMWLAAGVDVKYHFLMSSLHQGLHSPFRKDALRTARPLAVALAVMTSRLRDAEPEQMLLDKKRRVYFYRFASGSGPAWVAWALNKEYQLKLPLPAPTRAATMYGRELTPEIDEEQKVWTLNVSPEPVYLMTDAELDTEEIVLRDGNALALKPDRGEWHRKTAEREQAGTDGALSPPVEPAWVLTPADARWHNWVPGVVPAKGAHGDRILALTSKPKVGRKLAVEFHFPIPQEEAGRYEIWAAVAPVFFKENTTLAYSLDGQPALSVKGTDRPETYNVRYDGDKKAELTWERFGTVALTPGVHTLHVYSAAESEGGKEDTYHQFIDQLVFHKVEDGAGEKE